MSILLTGAAGFIGYFTAKALLAAGEHVIGVDDLNSYYDTRLKQDRLSKLIVSKNFHFLHGDISDKDLFQRIGKEFPGIDRIVHLAAQAGVRHSLNAPRSYIKSNVVGHLEVLEFARSLTCLHHLVYASSSSVYGGTDSASFAETERCDTPQSLYAATKRADELITYSYSHLYNIPATGLRFFTVYGPWGRPDMAPIKFTRAILQDEEFDIYNFGNMERDFTFIDDIVSGILASLAQPATGTPPHRILNLGNRRPERLQHFIELLETSCRKKAKINYKPMQPGDVIRTCADVSLSHDVIGYKPKVHIAEGIPILVDWVRKYYM